MAYSSVARTGIYLNEREDADDNDNDYDDNADDDGDGSGCDDGAGGAGGDDDDDDDDDDDGAAVLLMLMMMKTTMMVQGKNAAWFFNMSQEQADTKDMQYMQSHYLHLFCSVQFSSNNYGLYAVGKHIRASFRLFEVLQFVP